MTTENNNNNKSNNSNKNTNSNNPENAGKSGTANQFYRDFSNRRAYHNLPCRQGEVLVPVVLTNDMRKTLQPMGLNSANVETWHFPKPVPVAFIPVAESEKNIAMECFYEQVRWYLEGEKTLAGYTDDTEKMVSAIADYNASEMEAFIEYAESIRKEYGILLRGLANGCKHYELIADLGISGSKTLQHRKLNRMIREVQGLYRHYIN